MSASDNKTVLVTGGAGYIGAHACKALARAGYLPVTFDNLVTGHRWAVKWGPFEYGDILDRARLEQILAKHHPDAVLHFGIDKRACASEAQEFGFSTILQFFERFITAGVEQKMAMARSRDLFGFWQGLLRVVGSFGDCPRCLAVCPVGNAYHAHLVDAQRNIPEKTAEKVALAKAYKERRAQEEEIAGLDAWNVRWVGPDGYRGMVARQLQAFMQVQKRRSVTENSSGE